MDMRQSEGTFKIRDPHVVTDDYSHDNQSN